MKINPFKSAVLVMLAVVLANLIPSSSVQAGDGSAYDLISAVNSYRAANGLGELTANSYLMAAAQSQSDYLAATYVISSGANGHIGAGGTNSSDRAAAFGYGGGKAITVSENWAGTSSMSASELPYSDFWADSAHQNTMLDGWGTHYKDIGVGVSTNDQGVKFYVMDVGVVEGEGSYTPSTTNYNASVINGTSEATHVFQPLVTSTPKADGSVHHMVKYGETLSEIAKSYGVTVDQIRELNYMADGWTLINEGEDLLIFKKGSQATYQAKEVTGTPGTGIPTMDGTTTPSPTTAFTYTPRAITHTPFATLVIQSTPTATPVPQAASSTRSVGVVLLVVCGIGLLAVLGVTFLKPN